MTGPVINQIQVTREELATRYLEIIQQNPLLARMEGTCRSIGWTDEEIRTAQLLAACKSNASLTQRLREMEKGLAAQTG